MILGGMLFLFGLVIGSFLNAFLWRYQEKMTLGGRSMCPACKHQINWYDNIPLVSWLLLSGKCRYCKSKISIQYPLVELITGVLFMMIGIFSQPAQNIVQKFVTSTSLSSVVSTGTERSLLGFLSLARNDIILLLILLFIVAVMILISVYDYKTKEIPNGFNLTFVVGCLIYATLYSFQSSDFPHSYSLLLISSAVAFLFFYSLVYFSKETWMGGGDAKLAIGMGLLLGPAGTFLAIFAASISGSFYGISAILISSLKKKKISHEIPFGPFLAIGTFIVICFGAQIIDFYVKIILGL